LPKDLTKLQFNPEVLFENINKPLSSLGVIAKRGIVRGINERKKPDGSPQTRNKKSTIDRKGHNHPLIGGAKDSPSLGRVTTYGHKVEVGKRQTKLWVKRKRATAAYWLENREKYPRYPFFGISKKTRAEMDQRMVRYFRNMLRRLFT